MTSQLVHIPEVERLSPACIRILGGNPGKFTLQGTNTYLVGTGPRRLLIDTGEGKPSWIAALRRTLEEEKATVHAALITHWHADHTQGIPQLLAYSPQTAIHKYKCSPEPEDGQQQQQQDQQQDQQQQPQLLDIADGQTFAVEGATLTAAHTPGHTADHVCFALREEDALFTGDNVLGHGTAVFEDLGAYLASLARMRALAAGRAYPGHGPALPDAPAAVAAYVAHRRQREAQVLRTLGSEPGDQGHPSTTTTASATDGGVGVGVGRVGDVSGGPDAPPSPPTALGAAWTPMELVKVIYRDVHESLHVPAAGGVVQILQKLLAEDSVVLEDGDRWRLKGRPSL